MKLSKRHLKRIIREEYSRLKRRGLIREAYTEKHEELKHLLDDNCGRKCMKNILSRDYSDSLQRAMEQQASVPSQKIWIDELQLVCDEMNNMFGLEQIAVLDMVYELDRNILERILDDSPR
jgi:molecular chaperone GrpE (heat shock protein)